MIVYPDTSFILSLWHNGDVNFEEARRIFGKLSDETWLWCELHQLEVPIAAQAATFRQGEALKPHIARAIIFRAERAVTQGAFVRKQLPADAIGATLKLASAHGWKEKHTTLDLRHLGAAWELGAAYFATFDNRQAKVARSMGFRTNV